MVTKDSTNELYISEITGEANNIAEALEQAFLQGKALGYRQGWANGHREGFNVAYKDLTGAQ